LNAIAHRGKLARGSEPASLFQRVQFDDDAVGVEAKTAALLGPFVTELEQRVDACTSPPVRLDGQPPMIELRERLRMRCRAGLKTRAYAL
jgi:hypothetical protein